MKIINMWFNRPNTGRNYSGEQKVNFESPMPFSKCLRAKICSNINVYFDPQGRQTLLLKESEPLLFALGSWTNSGFRLNRDLWIIDIHIVTTKIIVKQYLCIENAAISCDCTAC